MPRFLIDANLPYRFAIWRGPDYLHVFDLDDTWPLICELIESHKLLIVHEHAIECIA